jgi:DNA-binding NtrC family response regulator
LETLTAWPQVEQVMPVIVASGTKQDTEHQRRIDIGPMKSPGKPCSLDQLLLAVAMGLRP